MCGKPPTVYPLQRMTPPRGDEINGWNSGLMGKQQTPLQENFFSSGCGITQYECLCSTENQEKNKKAIQGPCTDPADQISMLPISIVDGWSSPFSLVELIITALTPHRGSEVRSSPMRQRRHHDS